MVAALVATACGGVQRGTAPSTSTTSTTSATSPAGTGTVPAPTGSAASVPPLSDRAAAEPTGELIDGSITTPDGRERTYRLYVPSSLDASDRPPLVLALHGGTGWGNQFRLASGFDGIAEANQTLVVYPDGTELDVPITPNGRVWNGGNCCASAVRNDVDDVGFLVQLIDELVANRNADPERVFVFGHSNGGIMSYRLGCERPDKVRAIGLQAGWLGVESCTPAEPLSLMHIHGTADENAPIDGGRGPKSISGVEARAALESVGMVAAGDGCGEPPTETTAGEVTRLEWPDCPTGTEVVLVKVEGAPHPWIGDPRGSEDRPPTSFDSSAELWSYFAGLSSA